jgi:hypothetical protein
MHQKLTAIIQRVDGQEVVKGNLAGETTTHYLLKKEADRDGAGILEWFAKSAPRVTCVVRED